MLLFVVGRAPSRSALHEAGHLIPGKLFDVKVTQFFVGFGRTLWSRQKGETEYGVKAIPLGGYCKLVGMLPPEPGERPDRVRSRNTGMFAQLVSDARAAEYEHVDRGRPRPAVLQQAVVEAGHHHGLRGGDQPGARVHALRDRASWAYGVPAATTTVDDGLRSA